LWAPREGRYEIGLTGQALADASGVELRFADGAVGSLTFEADVGTARYSRELKRGWQLVDLTCLMPGAPPATVAGDRNAVAKQIVAERWDSRRGAISTQVLQEFYVNATRKIPSPIARAEARQIVKVYAAWQTELVGPPEIQQASELEEAHQLSFWDALIVAAALKGGASRILTEDMNDGQSISGVLIENPFARIL
jgi:predicted nucleic acid-binding protein